MGNREMLMYVRNFGYSFKEIATISLKRKTADRFIQHLKVVRSGYQIDKQTKCLILNRILTLKVSILAYLTMRRFINKVNEKPYL